MVDGGRYFGSATFGVDCEYFQPSAEMVPRYLVGKPSLPVPKAWREKCNVRVMLKSWRIILQCFPPSRH